MTKGVDRQPLPVVYYLHRQQASNATMNDETYFYVECLQPEGHWHKVYGSNKLRRAQNEKAWYVERTPRAVRIVDQNNVVIEA